MTRLAPGTPGQPRVFFKTPDGKLLEKNPADIKGGASLLTSLYNQNNIQMLLRGGKKGQVTRVIPAAQVRTMRPRPAILANSARARPTKAPVEVMVYPRSKVVSTGRACKDKADQIVTPGVKAAGTMLVVRPQKEVTGPQTIIVGPGGTKTILPRPSILTANTPKKASLVTKLLDEPEDKVKDAPKQSKTDSDTPQDKSAQNKESKDKDDKDQDTKQSTENTQTDKSSKEEKDKANSEIKGDFMKKDNEKDKKMDIDEEKKESLSNFDSDKKTDKVVNKDDQKETNKESNEESQEKTIKTQSSSQGGGDSNHSNSATAKITPPVEQSNAPVNQSQPQNNPPFNGQPQNSFPKPFNNPMPNYYGGQPYGGQPPFGGPGYNQPYGGAGGFQPPFNQFGGPMPGQGFNQNQAGPNPGAMGAQGGANGPDAMQQPQNRPPMGGQGGPQGPGMSQPFMPQSQFHQPWGQGQHSTSFMPHPGFPGSDPPSFPPQSHPSSSAPSNFPQPSFNPQANQGQMGQGQRSQGQDEGQTDASRSSAFRPPSG